MLDVLLESRAPRQRRIGSTFASAVLHGALIAGAVALTLPGRVAARSAPDPEHPPIFLVRPAPTNPPSRPPALGGPVGPPRGPELPSIELPIVASTEVPPVDLGPARPVDGADLSGPGVSATSPIGSGGPGLGAGAASALDESAVDRAPRLIGHAAEPRYPAALREAGIQGRVVVQFVVDTLGRAELGDLQVLESAHPRFVDAVREALARYHFSVGEASGHKVRTRVQLPFDFTLR